jgi:integrase
MTYQRGSLKKYARKGGQTWVLRYRVTTPEGRRVEHGLAVGLVRDFATEKDAWREVDRLALHLRVNDEPGDVRIRFDALAEHYLKADFGEDAVRPKSENTIPIVEHYVRDYLIVRWGKQLAEDIRPLEIQRWLKSLNDGGLAWTTVSKIRGIMLRVFKVGVLHEYVSVNPVEHVETRCKTNYRAIVLTPKQTLAVLHLLLPNPLHYALVLTCAATALRSSEILALRWADILWLEGKIRVSKRWAYGKDGETKTEASDGYVPMHPVLAQQLRGWHSQTPYAKQSDFVFPSFREEGKKPLYASSFVADYLRPAAITAGVSIAEGQRFGLHNLRHSLSNWLVNKAKVQAKTVQSLLRHAQIRTTLGLYTQEDGDETQAAQGEFLAALGMKSEAIQ